MIRKVLDRVGAGWIFLFFMVIVYVLIAFLDQKLFAKCLQVFVNAGWKILPILVLVFALIFIVNLLLTPKKTLKYLGKQSGIKGWLIAVASGILSTGPIYLWYPLLADLKESGMRSAYIAAFLYARAVKIPLLPLMIFYFGWGFTVLLNIYLIIFSFIEGFIVEKLGG